MQPVITVLKSFGYFGPKIWNIFITLCWKQAIKWCSPSWWNRATAWLAPFYIVATNWCSRLARSSRGWHCSANSGWCQLVDFLPRWTRKVKGSERQALAHLGTSQGWSSLPLPTGLSRLQRLLKIGRCLCWLRQVPKLWGLVNRTARKRKRKEKKRKREKKERKNKTKTRERKRNEQEQDKRRRKRKKKKRKEKKRRNKSKKGITNLLKFEGDFAYNRRRRGPWPNLSWIRCGKGG